MKLMYLFLYYLVCDSKMRGPFIEPVMDLNFPCYSREPSCSFHVPFMRYLRVYRSQVILEGQNMDSCSCGIALKPVRKQGHLLTVTSTKNRYPGSPSSKQ